MAYFSLHAYDADVWLREFRGLNQADIEMNPDIRFAAEAENVETLHGVLQPQAATEVFPGPLGDDSPRVETLAKFHRRWYSGSGSHNWYVCCAGGKFYNRQEGVDSWAEIGMPDGVSAFDCSLWSWVTYEYNPEISEAPIDVLIMSNAQDGMIRIIPPDKPTTWGEIKTQESNTWGDLKDDYIWNVTDEDDPDINGVMSPKWTIEIIDTRSDPEDENEPQKKFGVIERFQERICGTAMTDEPDKLVYSRPYLADDWTGPGEDEPPEDGAGDIDQPSWDGDKFYALKRFGDQLLAFKKNRIWRVMGVSPGEFDFHEQYGRGTEFFNTIAVEGERCYMATENGMEIYDGMNTTVYGKDQIEQIWKTVNKGALDQMCAALFDRKYYLSFPTGDSTVNNAMLVYDLNEGSILFYPDMNIEAFLPTDDELYATSSTLPGKILKLSYDSWTKGAASGAATKWVTPWMDFGYKQIQKGGFDFYFLPEVQDTAVTFTISVQTEKKKKTKTYTCQPLTEEQKAVPKQHRMKRMHFGGTGRKFRFMIETAADVTAPWRIIGGIQLIVETDPD